MLEEFVSEIGWTRPFIYCPANPLQNPYFAWCQVCRKVFSIRTKGTMEILRHHRTEKHLRKDQRWRYKHLKCIDSITGKVHHRVRGRNGKLLSTIELAKELPKFIHSELVDIGELFSFYDDFVKGRTGALITPDSWAKTQLSINRNFIQTHRDFYFLRNLRARISSYTYYQASL